MDTNDTGLTKIESAKFGEIEVDFWRNEQGDIFMTSEQIGRALEYADPVKAVSNLFSRNYDRLAANSVVLKMRSTDGKMYETRFFNEKGIYEIIRKSNQPKADEFFDWVYTVLSTIRKTGYYSLTPQFRIPQTYIEALEAHLRSEKEKLALQAKLEEQRPKVEMYDILLDGDNCQTVGEVAKAFGWGRNRLFRLLREKGVLMSNNLPYQQYLDAEYFEVREVSVTRGDKVINVTQTLVTAKGIDFIGDLLRKHGVILAEEESPRRDRRRSRKQRKRREA